MCKMEEFEATRAFENRRHPSQFLLYDVILTSSAAQMSTV